MKNLRICLLLLAAAACGPRNAPPAREAVLARAVSPASLVTPPVYALLGYREQLELTSDQVNAIDSIGTWLSRSNAPLLEREEVTPEEQANPLSRLMRVGENNSAAVTGIRNLLSPEQQKEVCEIFESSRADRDRQPERRRRGAERDSLENLGRTPWTWCVVTPAGSERRPR